MITMDVHSVWSLQKCSLLDTLELSEGLTRERCWNVVLKHRPSGGLVLFFALAWIEIEIFQGSVENLQIFLEIMS